MACSDLALLTKPHSLLTKSRLLLTKPYSLLRTEQYIKKDAKIIAQFQAINRCKNG